MPGETEETIKRFRTPTKTSSTPGGHPGGVDASLDWISKPQSPSVYYGPGGQGTSNVPLPPPNQEFDGGGDGSFVDTIDTGSGATGGIGEQFSSIDAWVDKFGNPLQKGIDILLETEENDPGYLKDIWRPSLDKIEPSNVNTGLNIDWLGGDIGYSGDTGKYQYGLNLNVDPGFSLSTSGIDVNPSASLMGNVTWAEGGPVNKNEIDQSGIMEMYDRHPEIESESEIEIERMGPVGRPRPPQAPAVPESFGATRDDEMSQYQAWKNAGQHVDPPNLGFYGEKIPAPIFDKAVKYLESLDPAERALVEEMLLQNMFRQRRKEFEALEKLSTDSESLSI